MTTSPLRRVLWSLVVLSLLPASVLVVRRVQAEGTRRSVTLVMDLQALEEQADLLGRDPFELALDYRELGLNGIAIYEQTPETLAASGRAATLLGAEARAQAAARGDPLPEVPGDATLVSALEPGALDAMLAKNAPPAQEVAVGGRSWWWYPGDSIGTRPAGPDPTELRRYAEAGFDIAYRPRNHPGLTGVGPFPDEARYLVHAGTQVAGWPRLVPELIDASQDHLTVVIEGTEQDGMPRIARRVPTARLLSFNQDYLNRRLRPAEVIDKYLLGVSERGIRMLYLRPYTEEQLGDMQVNTRTLVSGLAEALVREGYTIGPLETLDIAYASQPLLRGLAGLGVVAGLGLLALLYPGVWGVLAALGVLALGLLAGGFDWDALALVAALVFPVIGYGQLKRGLAGYGLALAISLAGAALLAAVGSDREAMLAIAPFAGVAATLVVPPALYALHEALRHRRPAQWIRDLWGHPVRLGEVAIVVVAAAGLALVVLRRGNLPVIGASEAELALRAWLSDLFVRPRFKELIGHPLAVLALLTPRWPAWLRGGLLTAGVVAQASVLNSFSHYHTPLAISLQRTLIAALLGLVLGLALLGLARLLEVGGRRWLERAPE